MLSILTNMPGFMLILGMFASYLQSCSEYAKHHQDETKIEIFKKLWYFRIIKTYLAIIGALLGFSLIPLVQSYFPSSLSHAQISALTGVLAFAAGYSGSLTIDKVVSKFHKYIDKL